MHNHQKRVHARHILGIWPTLNLARQFVLATSAFLIMSMIVLGAWVVDEIEDSVIQNMATSTAFYIDRSISPIAQELSKSHHLSQKSRKAFDELLSNNAFGKRMLAFTIWGKNGLVIYSSHGEIVGKTFEANDHLKGDLLFFPKSLLLRLVSKQLWESFINHSSRLIKRTNSMACVKFSRTARYTIFGAY